MAAPTKDDVAKLISDSGYPLELQVAKQLVDMGFKVQPSQQFFDVSRGKDVELDVVAHLHRSWQTKRGNTVRGVLRLGIECKDTSMPYVCFGLPHSVAPAPGVFDGDAFSCHVVTSRDDGLPNRSAIPLFDSDYGGAGLKSKHCHFSGSHRFHAITGVEEKGDKARPFKLHTPDKLMNVKSKLGAFVGDFHGYGSARPLVHGSRMVEDMGVEKGPMITVCFTMLLHAGPHFRYTLDGGVPEPAAHTPVFLSRSYAEQSISYVVDLVQYDYFDASLARLIDTFAAMVEYLTPWVFAAQKLCDA
jgi:hypothetical protein